MGLVTPLGCGVDASWDNLIAGRSGIRGIQGFDVSDLPSKIAGVIPRGDGPGDFNPDDWVEPKDRRKMADFILIGLAAAQQHQGKELSYNNLVDADAAYALALELPEPGVAIIKHTNPCGAATMTTTEEAFAMALAGDPRAAYGGILALDRTSARTPGRMAKITSAARPNDAATGTVWMMPESTAPNRTKASSIAISDVVSP